MNFKTGSCPLLVATDIAARGIDVPGVEAVINYDLPEAPEIYVHRIGRTARAGMIGDAISFCSESEIKKLQAIERLIKAKIKTEYHPTTLSVQKQEPAYNELPRRIDKKGKRADTAESRNLKKRA